MPDYKQIIIKKMFLGLASSIAHVGALDRRLNPTRCDAAISAAPMTRNKYVACRPNQRHKSTEIDDDLHEPTPPPPPPPPQPIVSFDLAPPSSASHSSAISADVDAPQSSSSSPLPPLLPVSATVATMQDARSPPFKPLRKSAKRAQSALNLTSDQVHFCSISGGITLPPLNGRQFATTAYAIDDDDDDEEAVAAEGAVDFEDADALSFVSLPATMSAVADRHANGGGGGSLRHFKMGAPLTVREEPAEEADEAPTTSAAAAAVEAAAAAAESVCQISRRL